jgi:DNA/RNA-binding domain of Phe-tRNA-synthetase-like protein
MKTDPEVEKLKTKILRGVDFTDIKKNSEKLLAFKKMSKLYGVDPTKRKPSPVALIDRLANGKDLYNINTVVDICNLIVVKYQISFGVFDLDHFTLPIELRFSSKGEIFTDLADGKDKPLEEGELIYADNKGLVMARDYNYRDSIHTIVTEKTTRMLFQVDGNMKCPDELVKKAFDEALELILKICGGEIKEKEFIGE